MSHYNSLQQAVFFKVSSQHISTPHWRDYQILEGLFESVKHGETPVSVLKKALNMFKESLDTELKIINHQLTLWLSQGRLPSRMHYLAVACANLISTVFDCMSILHEGHLGNLDEAVNELKNKVGEHEKVRESIISLSEQEGWVALQNSPGEFTPIVFILEWCITTYATGYSTSSGFKKQLKWIENAVQGICKGFETSLEFNKFKIAETDFIEVLGLIKLACLGVGRNRHCRVDFLELRGLLGVVAKSLSQLNELASKNITQEQVKENPALKNFNHIPLKAFPEVFINSCN